MASNSKNMFMLSRYSAVTILTVYLYIFMEWIFFVTKISFMNFMSTGEKIKILFEAGLFLSIPACILLLLFWIADLIFEKLGRIPVQFRLFPASMLASFLGLLLVDNFTYIVFGFGIISSTNSTRPLYIALVLCFLYYFYREFHHFLNHKKAKSHKFLVQIPIGLAGISLFLIMVQNIQNSTAQISKPPELGDVRKPNIIIFGTDGLDASHMSLYGYKRKTTPIIDELAKTSLVAENHFTNACCSVGSILSTLTGELPIEIGVLTEPYILQSPNSYQHFVNVLKMEGYYTVQWGNLVQINGDKWNMISGFDLINGYQSRQKEFASLYKYLGENTNYFIYEIQSRIVERVLHILYIKDMEEPSTESPSISDAQKIREIIKIIKNNNGPFFIHAHLMDTHGEKFYITKRVFSLGKTQDNAWDVDFMDDAILQYDQYVRRVIEALQEAGQLDNTIFIIYSDHGSKWSIEKKIPLVIRFPRGEYAGTIDSNTQNLDLVPTLLDYINLPQPEWTRGQSLLAPMDKHRLIFSFNNNFPTERTAPFFQFNSIRVTECQKTYFLELKTGVWQSDKVPGHTAPCNTEDLHPFEYIQEVTLDLLQDNGYDITSLLKP